MRSDTRALTAGKIASFVWAGILWVALGAGLQPVPASAQVLLAPGQLDQLVSRVALYPDPLLAQLLTASTYSNQIPEAAQWADQHGYLTGDNLAGAITQDNLPWDPSVQALLPFPSVLDMMATNIFWTRQLGDAVLAQRPDVMDAIQRMRQQARSFGYLHPGPQYRVVVSGPGIIQILPVDPAFYFLPIYDPLIVFGRPRAGLVAGITFGPRIAVGTAFAPWGWNRPGFGWASHTIVLDGRPWVRTRENHETYVHPYTVPRREAGPRVERHELRPTHPNGRERRHDGER
jgi:Protein of unknown function (DUF3300)